MPAHSAMLRAVVTPGTVVLFAACGGGDTGGNGLTNPPPPVPVATVSITAPGDTFIVGASPQLAATPKDSGGHALTGRTVSWSVLDPGLGSVSDLGKLTTMAIGVLRVVATVEGVSDTASLTLIPLASTGPHFPSLFVGDTVLLTVAFTTLAGQSITVPTRTWTTRDASIATVSSTGVVQGTGAGTVAIVANGGGGSDSQIVAVLSPRIGINREVIFSHDTGSQTANSFSELWISQADGSAAHRLTPADYTALMATWSPDGEKISFVGGQSVGSSTPLTLFTMAFDGSSLLPLAAPGGTQRLLPAWSPNSARLAVYDGATANIAVLNADGSNFVSLNTGSGVDTYPGWSPDGRQIAWRKDVSSCNEVWVMDADGTHQRKLVLPAGFLPCEIAWSPDGKELALAANGGIWLASVNGTGLRPLSPNCTSGGGCAPPDYSSPRWNPAGTKVTFSGAESGSQASVNVINRDGTGFLTMTVTTNGNSTYPQWSPDGRRIAFQLLDPADSVNVFPLIFATVDTNLQNPVYGRPGVRVAAPRWRP